MDDKGKAPPAFRGGITFDEFEEVVDPKHEREEAFFEKLGRELTTLKADFSVKAKLTGRDTIMIEAPLKTERQDAGVGYHDFGSATCWDDRPPGHCADLEDRRIFDKLEKALDDRGLGVKRSYDYKNEDLPKVDEPSRGFSQ